jgi:hypothetical protein
MAGAHVQDCTTEYAQQEADLLMEQIAADEADGNTREEDTHFAQIEPKTLRIIRNAIRKRKLKKFAQQTLPKAGKVAASILLVLFIGLSVAIASVQSVRVRVLEILINIEDEYTELSLQENPGSSFDVPAEWSGSFYPSKIPEGFTISQIEGMFGNAFVSYVPDDDKSNRITFLEQGEDTYANLDTEDAVLSSTMVKGSPALFVVKGKTVSVAWATDNLYFVLICQGLQEKDVLAIANSVVRIK